MFIAVMSEGGLESELLHVNANNLSIYRRCESQSSEDDDKKLKRREKNRVAAQRSRKKQTQKADKLHEEYEGLEQENSSLKKEVQRLTEERRYLTEALKAHEPHCPLVHCPMNLMPISRSDIISGCLPR